MAHRATLALSAAVLFALAGAASAADDPKSLAEYRKKVMDSMGGHAGAIAAMVKQEVSYDHLQAHADAIAATAPIVGDIFPENSGPDDYDDTDALPAIWEKPDAFKQAVEKFQAAAAAFPEAAASGDRATVMAAFKDLGGACGNCHETFRADD